MPQITLNLSQNLIDLLDNICTEAHRSRPGQVARWIEGTASGQVVDTPVYEYQCELTLEEAQAAQDAYDGPRIDVHPRGELIDEAGDVHGQLLPDEVSGLHQALDEFCATAAKL